MADASDLDQHPRRSAHRDRVKAYAGLLLCVLLWGMVFPGSARLLVRINAVQLVTLRFMLVSLAFVIGFSLRPSLIPRLARRQWLTVLVCGSWLCPAPSSRWSTPRPTCRRRWRPCSRPLLLRSRACSQRCSWVSAWSAPGRGLRGGAPGRGADSRGGRRHGCLDSRLQPARGRDRLDHAALVGALTLVVRPLTGPSAASIVGVVYITGTLTLVAAFPDALGPPGDSTRATGSGSSRWPPPGP